MKDSLVSLVSIKEESFGAKILLFALGLLILENGIYPIFPASTFDGGTRAAIDSYIEERMQTLKIPGAALAIVQGDQIEYLQGYGIADSTGRTVTPQTPFMLASVSKSFTAVAIMQLAEENKLDLDAPVQQYLTWFRVTDDKVSSQITVRHLLNHTSGFSEIDGDEKNLDTNMANDALIASMKQLATTKLISMPGSAFEYSNINYGLLGAIVETVSGQSFETYVQLHILDPLEMKHSYTSLADAKANGVASGYYPFFGLSIVYDKFMPYSRAVTPWAGIFSSAEDMAHYMIAHLNAGRFRDNSIISANGMAELHRPAIQIDKGSSYAMGWIVSPDSEIGSQDTTTIVSHGGHWAGFETIALFAPQKSVGLVLLMNANDDSVESAYYFAGWDVLAIYLGNKPSYYPPSEDFIRQHSRLLLAGINVLLLVRSIWFIRKLRRWRQQPINTMHRRQLFGYIMIPILIDLSIAWYLIARAHVAVLFLLRFAPDIGLLTILILLFTVGWGALRTLLILQIISMKAQRLAFPGAEGAR